jgi:hypothetical protein
LSVSIRSLSVAYFFGAPLDKRTLLYSLAVGVSILALAFAGHWRWDTVSVTHAEPERHRGSLVSAGAASYPFGPSPAALAAAPVAVNPSAGTASPPSAASGPQSEPAADADRGEARDLRDRAFERGSRAR